jgi:hypothetical protein
MPIGILALAVAALFSGAAIYVSVVEHPARSVLDAAAQLEQWKPSYTRGAMMQAPLAALGFVLGAVAWYTSGDWRWLVGALILVAAWPYTLLFIMPINRSLKAIAPSEAGPTSRALLERWGSLHLVRTALGVVATTVFVWPSMS